MDYWLRFMQRYPRVDDLAAATEDEVLRLWQGLGYYSRARNLHAAARQIAHRGSFPDTFQEIRQLKGVGDYTAAAVASIAFHRPVAVVDGNVYRVLSRYFGIFTPINSTEGKKEFAALAQSLLPPQAPARYNEALMDFGALQCKPVTAAKASPKTRSNIGETLQPDLFSPSPAVDHSVSAARLLSSAAPSFCAQCPLGEGCVAYREGWVAQLPVKLKKTKVKTRRMTYLYIRCKGHIALRRRGSGDIWQGLWEPVLYKDVEDKSTPAHAAQRKEMPLEMETGIAPTLAALPFQTIEFSLCVAPTCSHPPHPSGRLLYVGHRRSSCASSRIYLDSGREPRPICHPPPRRVIFRSGVSIVFLHSSSLFLLPYPKPCAPRICVSFYKS